MALEPAAVNETGSDGAPDERQWWVLSALIWCLKNPVMKALGVGATVLGTVIIFWLNHYPNGKLVLNWSAAQLERGSSVWVKGDAQQPVTGESHSGTPAPSPTVPTPAPVAPAATVAPAPVPSAPAVETPATAAPQPADVPRLVSGTFPPLRPDNPGVGVQEDRVGHEPKP